MKQVIQNYRSGMLKVQEVPAPGVSSRGLLVANQFSLISAGTEKSTVQVAQKSLIGKALDRPEMVKKVLNKIHKDGLFDTVKMVFERLDAPAALGYSCSGTILEVGDRVEEFKVGDLVACAGQNYASHAGIVSVPRNLCVNVPNGVNAEDASFVALGAIALQGIRQGDPRLGERIAVIGLGLLGQLTVQMLKAAGCQVIASDLDPLKLKLAKDGGADITVLPESLIEASGPFTSGHGVDAVIITAGSKGNDLVEMAGEIARKKGRVIIVGAVGMNLPREPYYKKELELRLSTSYGPGRYDSEYEEKGNDYPIGFVRWTEKRNMEAFLNLIQQRKININPLVSHRYSIFDAEKAYRLMMHGEEPYLGILISYPFEESPSVAREIQVNPSVPFGRLNLGIMGAGNHVKDMLLPHLMEMPEVNFVSICTASGFHARAVAEKVKATICTTDYRQILSNNSVNAVIIGTRHHMHGPMVLEALRAGKHVFVEKPLCLTEEELENIRVVYAEKALQGIQLVVGFNRRFSSHMEKAKEFFKGRQSPLVMVYRINAGPQEMTHWSQDPEVGGGRIVGEACHFIDYMQDLCGALPASVHAMSVSQSTSRLTDDQSILLFTFKDGSIGTVIYTAGGDTSLSKERFEAFGDGRSLVMDDFVRSEFYSTGKKTVFKTGKRDKGFKTEMTLFVQSILQGEMPMMSFAGIEAVTRASLLAVKSMRTGRIYDL
ncbi:MAG: bi-domain-containing oxidoreductase [Nitrospiria bacterium]